MGVDIQSLEAHFGKGVQLREDAILLRREGVTHFYGKHRFDLKNLSGSEHDFLEKFKSGVLLEILKPMLCSPRLNKLVGVLVEKRVLRTMLPPEKEPSTLNRQLQWMSHFGNDPSLIQREFSTKKVMILGCGGTGAIAAMHLLRAGLKHFVLIDGSKVDAPDLNRQLTYNKQNIGQSKVLALEDYLKSFDGAVDVQCFNQTIAAAEDIQALLTQVSPDFIINCADQPLGLIHAWVSQSALVAGVPVLFGGVGLEDGTIGPLLVSAQAKAQYARQMLDTHAVLGNGHRILQSSLAFTNTMIGAALAFETFKFLTGTGSTQTIDRLYQFNFNGYCSKVY